MLRQQLSDVLHDFRDALFFLQDVGGELRGRQVRDVFLGVWVLAVKVGSRERTALVIAATQRRALSTRARSLRASCQDQVGPTT